MRLPPPGAGSFIDPEMSMDSTTSRACILRVTSAAAATPTFSKPSRRMKVVGTEALAATDTFSFSMSALMCGPSTAAPR